MNYDFDRNEEDYLAIWFNPKEFFIGFDQWADNDDKFGLEIEFSYTDNQEKPSESQMNAFEFLMEHKQSIFENLLAQMNQDKEVWIDVFYMHNGESESGFPNCENPHDLHGYFSFDKIRIDNDGQNNFSFIGLMGGCEWDGEHGFGAILHKEQVIDIGGWDTGYAGPSSSSIEEGFLLAKKFGLEPLEERRERIRKASETIQIEDTSIYKDLFQWLIDQQVIYGYRCTEPDLNDKEIVAFIKDLRFLDFTSKGLEELPESFAALENVRALTLRNNKFKVFPKVLGELPSLKHINLSYNSIAEIPAGFAFKNPIKTLDLSGNQFTNIDLLLENQKELTRLFINKNQLASLPDFFGELLALEDLRMEGNHLSSLPESIGQLTSLKMLIVNKNNLSSLPESIGQLSQLRSFNCQYNQITTLPKSMEKLQSLRSMDVSYNLIAQLPEVIFELPNLQSFRIFKNKLTSLPKKLNTKTKPFRIYVWGNPFPLDEIEKIMEWIDPEFKSDIEATKNDLLRKERELKQKQKEKVQNNKPPVQPRKRVETSTDTNNSKQVLWTIAFIIFLLILLAKVFRTF